MLDIEATGPGVIAFIMWAWGSRQFQGCSWAGDEVGPHVSAYGSCNECVRGYWWLTAEVKGCLNGTVLSGPDTFESYRQSQ